MSLTGQRVHEKMRALLTEEIQAQIKASLNDADAPDHAVVINLAPLLAAVGMTFSWLLEMVPSPEMRAITMESFVATMTATNAEFEAAEFSVKKGLALQ
jgi:hypothetical protein